jgi:LysR family transcriptional regulator (chromosome initiation inhibitor)
MQYIAVATPDFAKKRLGLGEGASGKHNAPALTQYNFRDVPFIAFNRKDELPVDFVGKAFGLKRVTLNQLFVPSSEGMVRAVLAGWGVSVVPRLLAQGLIDQGQLVNLVPAYTLPVQLYWHCWNLESEVLDALTAALKQSAAQSLVP